MRSLKKTLRAVAFPTLCVCGVFYFAHYALNGRYGQGALATLRAENAHLSVQLAGLEAQRERLGHRAGLLASKSVDPDMLDERSRALLGYAHPEDIVVLREDLNAIDP